MAFSFVRSKKKNKLLKDQYEIIENQKVQLEQSVFDLRKRTEELNQANVITDIRKICKIIGVDDDINCRSIGKNSFLIQRSTS